MTPFINNIQLSLRSQHLATCGLTTTSLLSTELLSDQEVCNLCTMLKQMPTCLTAEGDSMLSLTWELPNPYLSTKMISLVNFTHPYNLSLYERNLLRVARCWNWYVGLAFFG